MLMVENFNKREEDRHIKFYFEILPLGISAQFYAVTAHKSQ